METVVIALAPVLVALIIAAGSLGALARTRRLAADADEAAARAHDAVALTARLRASLLHGYEEDTGRWADEIATAAHGLLGCRAAQAALAQPDLGLVIGEISGASIYVNTLSEALQQAAESGAMLTIDGDECSVVAMPLISNAMPLGAVAWLVDRPSDPTTDLLTSFMAMVSDVLAVRRAHHLTEGVLRDPVTGLPTRRGMTTALASVRPGDSIVLLELDTERCGPVAFNAFARHLRSSLREKDAVARWSNRTFLAVIPVPAPIAEERVERIRDGWESTQGALGFSAGVVMHSGGDVEPTIDAATDALRSARDAGGGRTWVHC